jgi:hypothetical protein
MEAFTKLAHREVYKKVEKDLGCGVSGAEIVWSCTAIP